MVNHYWGEAKVPPFLGVHPFLLKRPQDNFSLQNANGNPPKYKVARGDFCVFLYKHRRLEVANPFLEGVNKHFGGCKFAFWRLKIQKLSWSCFIERGVIPKKGWYFGFPRTTAMVWFATARCPDLFSRGFREGISFPKFVERSTLKLPLSKLCAVPLALQNRAFFEGRNGRKGCRA